MSSSTFYRATISTGEIVPVEYIEDSEDGVLYLNKAGRMELFPSHCKHAIISPTFEGARRWLLEQLDKRRWKYHRNNTKQFNKWNDLYHKVSEMTLHPF